MSPKKKSDAFRTSADRARERFSSAKNSSVRFPRLDAEQWKALMAWLEARAPNTASDPFGDPTLRLVRDARAALHREILQEKPTVVEPAESLVSVIALE